MYVLRKMFSDIKQTKDLIWYLTISDFKATTARSLLGLLWWIIDPILNILVFYFLVEVIMKRGGDNYITFLLVGLIPMKWTISCLVDSTTAITSKGRILQQVFVPKVVFIATRLLVNAIKFVISTGVLIVFLMCYGVPITSYFLYFPFIVLTNAVFLFGSMMILAHVGVYIRDIKNVIQYGTRMLYYMSPVLFSLDKVPESLLKWLYINPLTTIIVSYRNVILYQKGPELLNLTILLIFSVVLLYVGLKLLFKFEKHYAKVI